MKSQHARARRVAPPRFRPRLEALDDRSVPAVVFTTVDNGNNAAPTPGSLRAAIIAAYATPGPDTITFDINPNDPGQFYYRDDGVAGHVSLDHVTPTAATDESSIADIDPDWKHTWWSIRPPTALPEIRGPVTIDGYSQPGAVGNSLALGSNAVLRIELDGEAAGLADGLVFHFGGGSTVTGLIVNRFGRDGISLNRNGAGSVIQGNILGLDPSGTVAVGNAHAGFRTANAGALIGGTDPKARNVISANQYGIILSNSGSNFNVAIQGNYIGTDSSGTLDRGNSNSGIDIGSAPGTWVGGDKPGAGNVIAGNRTGVFIGGISHRVLPGGFNCLVQGNFIGLDATGEAPLGNTNGVQVINSYNLIGGLTPNPGHGTGNVISGNDENGISVVRHRPFGPRVEGTVVQGNIIGLDASGTERLGNGHSGFRTTDAGAQVGGVAAGARNIISANRYGVLFSNSGTDYRPLVQGNFIGTDVAGMLDLGNSDTGVSVGSAPGTIVGGAPGAGNVISGNGVGVSIGGISHPVLPRGHNCAVQGNIIGLNATGTAAVGNTTGILITNSDNLVGDSFAAFRNVISGNTEFGVHIKIIPSTPTTPSTPALRNYVLGNCIGADITGTRDMGNGLDGVFLSDETARNVIDSNAVLFNHRDGIGLANADKNTIHSNTSNRNVRDGVRLDGLSTSNLVSGNVLLDNGEHDRHDDTPAAGALANAWPDNVYVTSNF